MHLCIFNPEHDLCLAKGRANYVPPRSAVEFAHRDAGLMQVLYPGAYCCSVYDLPKVPVEDLQAPPSPAPNGEDVANRCSRPEFHFSILNLQFHDVIAWGWNLVVKHELLKRGIPECVMPSDEELTTIRNLQHRTTVLPLQPDCHAVYSIDEMEALLAGRTHWVMKAPWSGAGRGLRWVHGRMTDIDRDWLQKTVEKQRCVIAEPRRDVVADVALEYMDATFAGYSFFKTGSGVYKENLMWSDDEIANHFSNTALQTTKTTVEQWLGENIFPRYRGPLGVDLMICEDGSVQVAEINFRHTMGMVAHEKRSLTPLANPSPIGDGEHTEPQNYIQ